MQISNYDYSQFSDDYVLVETNGYIRVERAFALSYTTPE